MNVLHKTVMAAAASGALLTAVAQPAEAFTLSAPTSAAAVATADVQNVYYYYHYGYRPYGYRPYYAPRPYYGYGYGYRRWHCWWGPYGRRCGW